MSRLIGLLGQGVGVAAEYREHRKEQKLVREKSSQNMNAESSQSNGQSISSTDLPPAYADNTSSRSISSGTPAYGDKIAAMDQKGSEYDYSSAEDDEEDWRLDEMISRSASADPPSYDDSEKQYANTDLLVENVMNTQGLKGLSIISTSPRKPLPCPVILPQRRPGSKDRGFVRAYAPLLGECSGIDQETFLSFLENFHRSSQASPIFGIIQISAAFAGFAPGLIAMAVTTSVQIAAQVGAEAQKRYRTNDFLNKMNEELFKPKGLFAMIVKYQSEQEAQASGNNMLARFGVGGESVDMATNQTIAKYEGGLGSSSSRMQKFRTASSSTQGAVNIPESAPLIFPDVDKAIVNGEETIKDKAKDAGGFLQDYMDRRAQMKYAREDPNSSLVVPEAQRNFRSKLADPQHPMYNGGIVGLLSGGALTREGGGGGLLGGGGRGGRGDRRDRRDRSGDRRVRSSDRRDRSRDGRGKSADRDDRRMEKYKRRMDNGRDLKPKQQRRYDRMMDDQDMRRGYGNQPAPYGGQPGYCDNQSVPYGGQSGYYDNQSAPYGGQSGYYVDRPAPDGGRPSSYGNQSTDYDGRSASYGGRNRDRGGDKDKGGLFGGVKRMMKSGVLYLTIVNLPSEAELEEARQKLQADGGM